MEYISAEQAAKKWGISLRLVQRLAAEKRIAGIKREGGRWLIPAFADKPADPRRPQRGNEDYISCGSLHISAVPPQKAGWRAAFDSETAYLCGDFVAARSAYMQASRHSPEKLCAAATAIAAAISDGDYRFYAQVDSFLHSVYETGEGDAPVLAQMAQTTAAMSMSAPSLAPQWLRDGRLDVLPAQGRQYGTYLYAKYLQSVGENEGMLHVAKTALYLQPAQPGTTLPDVYLRLLCAAGEVSHRDTIKARQWLREAMSLGLPLGWITPFAETATVMAGITQEELSSEFMEYEKPVLSLWKRTRPNWVRFHNQFTNSHISDILTLRECQIALLAAKKIPYAQIASRYGISVGRLKNIMQDIYGKLFISGRDELAKYIL